jgi:hypothetical protein
VAAAAEVANGVEESQRRFYAELMEVVVKSRRW